jgi:RNA polymerase sigma factor (sigma-70 family)
VPARGDRQELGQPLGEAEDDGFEDADGGAGYLLDRPDGAATPARLPDMTGEVALLVAEPGLRPREKAEAWFGRLYEEHWDQVLSYALRRTRSPEDAADVVADTFLVAWRRAADVPPGEEARAWLYGVARRVLANQRRGAHRRDRLVERLRDDLATEVSCEPPPAGQAAVTEALGRMKEEDREVLLLAGWEQLQPAEIAVALGVSTVAARSRLHRARRRFRREFGA